MLTEREAQIAAIVTDTIMEKLASGGFRPQSEARGEAWKPRPQQQSLDTGDIDPFLPKGVTGEDILNSGIRQHIARRSEARMVEGRELGKGIKELASRVRDAARAGRAEVRADTALSKSQWPSPYRLVD